MLGLIKAPSGLKETVVRSPLPLTEIGLDSISAFANFTLHFPPEISETSPPKVLFSPINSATNELQVSHIIHQDLKVVELYHH